MERISIVLVALVALLAAGAPTGSDAQTVPGRVLMPGGSANVRGVQVHTRVLHVSPGAPRAFVLFGSNLQSLTSLYLTRSGGPPLIRINFSLGPMVGPNRRDATINLGNMKPGIYSLAYGFGQGASARYAVVSKQLLAVEVLPPKTGTRGVDDEASEPTGQNFEIEGTPEIVDAVE